MPDGEPNVRPRSEELRRLRQFVSVNLVATAGALFIPPAVYLLVDDNPWVLFVEGVVAATLAMFIGVIRLIHQRRLATAILATCLTIWTVALAVTFVVPPLLALMAALVLYPAVIAVPYLRRERLLFFLVASAVVITVVAVLGTAQDVTGLSDEIPDWISWALTIGILPVISGFVALAIWDNSAWLNDALAETEHVNRALRASQDQLAARAAELQDSRARIVAAADAERQRIERDLHDGAQLHLVALALGLQLARDAMTDDPVGAAEELDRVSNELQSGIDELRNLAHGIYPPLLTERGLAEALIAVVGRANQSTTIDAAELRSLSSDLEATVYFCCLEALQNAAKYAGPEAHVAVRLWTDRDLHFEVTDDGHGFDMTGRPDGTGLVNIRDRIGAVGGELTVQSAPQQGTRISARIPLPVANPPPSPASGRPNPLAAKRDGR